MRPASDSQASNQDAARPTGGPAFQSADELVGFAREYFVNDFPNPERRDCDPGRLKAAIFSGAPPGTDLRAHLFSCSECFREYRSALEAYRAERRQAVVIARTGSWWSRLRNSLLLRPLPILAGAVSLLLLIFAGAYLWQRYQTRPSPALARQESEPENSPAENPPTDSPPPAPSPSATAQAAQAEPGESPGANGRQTEVVRRPRPSNQGDLIATSVVRIDLEDYAATRGGAGGSIEIGLTLSRVRLVLALPEGSAPGMYSVSIVDASGAALVTSRARSGDGKTLTATLDVRRLAPQKYGLRVSRAGEPPVDVPVVISAG